MTRLSCRRGRGAFNTTRQYYFGVPRETRGRRCSSRAGGARCDEGAGSRLSDGPDATLIAPLGRGTAHADLSGRPGGNGNAVQAIVEQQIGVGSGWLTRAAVRDG